MVSNLVAGILLLLIALVNFGHVLKNGCISVGKYGWPFYLCGIPAFIVTGFLFLAAGTLIIVGIKNRSKNNYRICPKCEIGLFPWVEKCDKCGTTTVTVQEFYGKKPPAKEYLICPNCQAVFHSNRANCDRCSGGLIPFSQHFKTKNS